MKKEELVKTASALQKPSAEAIAEFSEKADGMINRLNQRFSERKDIELLIGEGNLDMMHDNHRNHIRFMISLFNEYDPVVFTETVLWVFRAYRSHGFRLTYWPAQLDNWVEVFKNELSPACFNQIYPFYHWMIVNNPAFALISDQAIFEDTQAPLGKHE